MNNVLGEIVKKYMTKSRLVIISKITRGEDNYYNFKIIDRCEKKDYYSMEYTDLDSCEKDSHIVVKKM